MSTPLTHGTHHIGLTVSDLEASAAFFTELLGWREIRRDDRYPAIFVSDGSIMVTLWKAQHEQPTAFDKNTNVGLHHLALRVGSEDALHDLHDRLEAHGVPVEFKPELLRQGPMKHMMCYEPSGIRIEFIWPGEA